MQEMTKAQQKQRVRGRIRAATDPEYYSYTPESTKNDYVKSEDEHRVAIYARVSTEHEAQINALGNQIQYYDNILAQHPDWELYDRYIDEGITGTSIKKRKNFMRMIEDAKAGKIQYILAKSISRFARNTVDTLA